MLNTVSEVIEGFGGAADVASLNGVTVEAVYNAIRRGSLPHPWRLRLYQEAQARNLAINPSLLGVSNPAEDAA